jgi:hypothetical protein
VVPAAGRGAQALAERATRPDRRRRLETTLPIRGGTGTPRRPRSCGYHAWREGGFGGLPGGRSSIRVSSRMRALDYRLLSIAEALLQGRFGSTSLPEAVLLARYYQLREPSAVGQIRINVKQWVRKNYGHCHCSGLAGSTAPQKPLRKSHRGPRTPPAALPVRRGSYLLRG